LVDGVKDYAIIMLDPAGRVASWNAGAERIKGYRADEIISCHFSCFYPRQDIASGKPAKELAIAATTGRFEEEGWRLRKDGSRFWANVVITALRDASGNLRGYAKVSRDITARKEAEVAEKRAREESRQSEEQFRLLVDGVKDYAIFMLDKAGCVVTWNTGAERIKGYRADEIIGRHFSCFYTREDIEAGKPAIELESAATDGQFEEEGWRLRKDGSRFWANVVITALRDASGNLRGYAKVSRDNTARKEAEAAGDETQSTGAATDSGIKTVD
jgi:PAS domain S-box-containing protein